MPIPFIIGGLAAIGSAVTGAAATAGAVAAGAAAAAGTAAAGAAAAAGTAAAAVGTAAASTTVGSAVVGAATTAGAAVASSAVGSTAIGAMTAVGTGIGTTAAALGNAPVIGGAATALAKTTGVLATGAGAVAGQAGATTVGTIATTGAIGAANGVAGAAKLAEASDIKDGALTKYKDEKVKFESEQDKTNTSLKKLGEEKLKIWQSFERFSVMYSKIQNPPTMSGDVDQESLTLNPDELENIRAVAISAKDLLSGGVASVAAGNLIGLAVSGGLISSITVASTGTAISTLSGAAATNAMLAALGGGSLAAGGAGMAGGAVALGGLTVAPMLMVSGIMLNGQAKKSLEAAKDIELEAGKAVASMAEAEKELRKVKNLSNSIRVELGRLNSLYSKFMDSMESIVRTKTDYNKFNYAEKRTLEKTILSLKLIKMLSMQNILDSKNKVLVKEIRDSIAYTSAAREDKLA